MSAPYFEVVFSYRYKSIHSNFVKDVYSTIFQNGFPYKKPYYAPRFSLEDVISWNQKKLENKFILGGKQDWEKHDYKQILLEREGYEGLRLFWFYRNDEEIELVLITSESDVLDDNNKFIPTKITPFIELSKKLWVETDVNIIEAWPEVNASRKPFSLMNKNHLQRVQNFKFEDLVKEGIILLDKTLLS
jgi:hypothetical protein